jgi:hypothetical protein
MPPIVLADGRVIEAGPSDVSCDRIACTTDAARYCGMIGDNCGGTLDCGACPSGQVCEAHICLPDFDGCVPLPCMQPGGSYCGRIGDGCGRLLDCGNCTSPLSCGGGGLANICGVNPDSGMCNATTCTPPNGRYCGVVGNGCGGQLDCGTCPAGQDCGAAGIPQLCGTPNCTKATCTPANGAHYCGEVGDGCGGKMDCGNCDPGQACGGGGLPGLCGYLPDSGNCTPITCRQTNGKYCGVVGNGCGGQMDCGNCDSGQTCGAGGVPNICAYQADSGICQTISCTPANGRYCGIVGNGCGGQMDCGMCTGGDTCGGGGISHVCGAAPDSGTCNPTICTQASGKYCGVVGNGCGGQVDCGMCPSAQTCGGGGIPNVCGAAADSGTCTPTTCTPPNGTYCGTVGNGCGGSINCGACPAGQICGARAPNVCGKVCPLCPQVPTCADGGAGADGGSTTVSGTAYTPALTNPDPLYGALVYIPNIAPGTKLPPFTDGPSCDRCSPLSPDEAQASALPRPEVHPLQRTGRHRDPARRPAREMAAPDDDRRGSLRRQRIARRHGASAARPKRG